ncbi:MAG: histidinol-phosphatase HisJ family protein [Candidatus Limivivens sp.]|nr:histidinol-phosphatase HisJ family protein [Candidatus Limivivens sp.]
MQADFHIHSSFSADSDTPMEDMVQEGIRKGLRLMCFTEHMDRDYPDDPEHAFEVDTAAYYQELMALKERYAPQIQLLFGIELGLEPHLAASHRGYLADWPFDYVIGSSHLVNRRDPYYPSFYEGREEADCYLEYFQSVLTNLQAFSEMDAYGHLDYVVRYGPNQNRYYSYEAYRDILDEILKLLIEKDVALEVNTAGFKYGLGHPNPQEDVLRRYRELGGEKITVGSDGHAPEHLAFAFGQIRSLLESCGFRYYTVFHRRRAEFLPLSQS